jgi:hypothetical protein
MNPRYPMAVLLATLPLAGGCLASWNVDSWATACPYHCDEVWHPIDHRIVHVVPTQNLPEATELLLNASIVPLSQPQAPHLAGQELTAVSGAKLYLVRAVALVESNGGYNLSTRNRVLWVSHNCMGGWPCCGEGRPITEREPLLY